MFGECDVGRGKRRKNGDSTGASRRTREEVPTEEKKSAIPVGVGKDAPTKTRATLERKGGESVTGGPGTDPRRAKSQKRGRNLTGIR